MTSRVALPTSHSASCGHPGYVPDDYLEHLDGLGIETTITAAELCAIGTAPIYDCCRSRIESRQTSGVHLVVTEPASQVKDLVGAFIYEIICSCPVDERSERGLTSGIEVHPESCFNLSLSGVVPVCAGLAIDATGSGPRTLLGQSEQLPRRRLRQSMLGRDRSANGWA